ncbi:ABC transporter permease subunit [Alphaproteobacteria bacterium KMM 3653]|uniref:sn-glycerol-3-phosphate transport system permease protein UgpE n=1 Tax=Harenicola maris TaxID=2841044 RepID=A0AAP2CQK1_9RHOB|nr:ABC transporter permease subunit [Harenicola maris]
MKVIDGTPQSRFIAHLILLAGVVFLVGPIVVLIASSTHGGGTLRGEGLQIWPGAQAAVNYGRVLTLEAGFTDQITALDMMRNSLIVAFGVAAMTTLVSLIGAYGLVYFRFPAAGALFWVTLSTLLLPLESRFLTTFQVTAHLGMIDTHIGMILPVLSLALGTLFFRQLFLSFPDEYLEAATLDGAGPLKFLRDFILPLSWRRGGAIFVVTFMIGWNQYMWPLMISTGESHYTLVRGIQLIGQSSGAGMALAVLSIVPPLLLVFIFQRWFFQSLADDKAHF